MYKIIGGDKNEYGPISAEQIRQWITECRVNNQTQTQAEGGSDWKPLAAFPEFADALMAQARAQLAPQTAPATPPPFSTGAASSGSSNISEGDYQLDLGGCITRGWEVVKANFGVLFGGFVIYILVIGVIAMLAGIPWIGFLFSIANMVISGPLIAGLFYLSLRAVRGEGGEISDVFAGFKKSFGQLFLGYLIPALLQGLCLIPVIVVGATTVLPALLAFLQHRNGDFVPPTTSQIVIVCIVGLLCLLPMIFLKVCWMFTLPLIIDRQMDFLTAMKTSWRKVNQHWWQVFGLVVLIGLLNVAGVLLCCVGILVTMPIGFAALMRAYETIFSGADGKNT